MSTQSDFCAFHLGEEIDSQEELFGYIDNK